MNFIYRRGITSATAKGIKNDKKNVRIRKLVEKEKKGEFYIICIISYSFIEVIIKWDCNNGAAVCTPVVYFNF